MYTTQEGIMQLIEEIVVVRKEFIIFVDIIYV